MSDRPILFSAPMVRALLEGRKTQTRRLLKLRGHQHFSEFGPSDTPGYDWHFRHADGCWCDHRQSDLPLPYAIGDRLWVREAWRTNAMWDHLSPTALAAESEQFGRVSLLYEAGGVAPFSCGREDAGRYRHARFMARRAATVPGN